MIQRVFFGVGAGLALFSAPAMAQTAPAAGQAVFKAQCAMCHAVVAGKNGLGPSLAGVLNRKPGAVPGFAYSGPMKAYKGKWDAKTLDKFLASPGTTIPGSRMAYAGQKDATRRAALVAYLATLK